MQKSPTNQNMIKRRGKGNPKRCNSLSSVHLLSRVQLFVTPCAAAFQAFLSITLELAQTHVSRSCDAIQPSHPLSFPSPPAFNLAQHQGLFQGISSSHQVAKVLELQLQNLSQKEKDKYHFLTHIYGFWKNGTDNLFAGQRWRNRHRE